MFGNKMNLGMDEYFTTGHFLSLEERLVLQVSLPELQMQNRFSSVSFRGKILGTAGDDYYIACGRGKDFIRNKMFFYSLEGQLWRILFPPSLGDLTDFRYTRNRFTGDPTYVHRFNLGEKKVSIREETRLSAAVHLLDWETGIGPRGALQIDPRTGMATVNPYFEGLEDPTALSSYVHHRLPTDKVRFAASLKLCPSAGDAALEFLDPVQDDYPTGCWMLRSDPEAGVVRLQSLWWPGHTFYCRKDGRHDSLYIGLGVRNDDLPYMIG